MTLTPLRVLGIDTALRTTGVGVVEATGPRLLAIEYGLLRNPARRPLSACLAHIHAALTELIARTAPGAVAIEGAFFSRNARTALTLGQARGAALAACAAAGLPIYEYAPRRVKQAVVGFGGAEKGQVRAMVMRLLNLREEPAEDAGDALAIAISHLHAAARPLGDTLKAI